MKFHLYQRTLKSKGKSVKAWYYWYYDDNGNQVRKSCGVKTKRDAEAFIYQLETEYIQTKDKEIKKVVTFNEFCNGFYNPESRFILKQKARGYEYMANTIYQKKLYLSYFLAEFGNQDVTKLKTVEIENWLLSRPQGNAVKNSMLGVIEEIYQELYAYELIEYIPLIKKFKRNTKSKGVLSIAEIHQLFPDNYDELIQRWRLFNTETESEIYSFAVMVFTILSTGLRSCEVRALQWEQLIDDKALLINAMFNSDEVRVNHLKKGDKDNKKWRVTVLPLKTIRYLQNLRNISDQIKPEDFIFTSMGEHVTSDYLLSHFKVILDHNGINWKERNITIHSLRFTYNTIMKKQISGEDLRLMIGHASEQMTEYYDKSKALDSLPGLLKNQDIINSVWN